MRNRNVRHCICCLMVTMESKQRFFRVGIIESRSKGPTKILKFNKWVAIKYFLRQALLSKINRSSFVKILTNIFLLALKEIWTIRGTRPLYRIKVLEHHLNLIGLVVFLSLVDFPRLMINNETSGDSVISVRNCRSVKKSV